MNLKKVKVIAIVFAGAIVGGVIALSVTMIFLWKMQDEIYPDIQERKTVQIYKTK